MSRDGKKQRRVETVERRDARDRRSAAVQKDRGKARDGDRAQTEAEIEKTETGIYSDSDRDRGCQTEAGTET